MTVSRKRHAKLSSRFGIENRTSDSLGIPLISTLGFVGSRLSLRTVSDAIHSVAAVDASGNYGNWGGYRLLL
jgi:hypothetical protein